MTRVMQVIFTDNKIKGSGVYPDPVRGITEILDFDGNTIVEHDPCVQYTEEQMLSFAAWFKDKPLDKHNDLNGFINEWQMRLNKPL